VPKPKHPHPRSVYLGLRLPPDLDATLKKMALQEHNGVSPIARRLISIGLAIELQGGRRED
jgi:hypothetical protein